MTTTAQRRQLLALARESIRQGLAQSGPPVVDMAGYDTELHRDAATFVTLRIASELRGCIGSLEPCRPLIQDVARNAHAAAFHDPRFGPLAAGEFPVVSIQISILSTPTVLAATSEAELIARLRPGTDGLTLVAGMHRATFLPAVWESLPEPLEFVRQLKRKAGLTPDAWSTTFELSRYTTESFSEPSE